MAEGPWGSSEVVLDKVGAGGGECGGVLYAMNGLRMSTILVTFDT